MLLLEVIQEGEEGKERMRGYNYKRITPIHVLAEKNCGVSIRFDGQLT